MNTEPIYEFHKSRGWVPNLGVIVQFLDVTCRLTVVDVPVIGKHYDYWIKDSGETWDFERNVPNWDEMVKRYSGYNFKNDISQLTARDLEYFRSIGYLDEHRFWLVIEECK